LLALIEGFVGFLSGYSIAFTSTPLGFVRFLDIIAFWDWLLHAGGYGSRDGITDSLYP
jgi:hypothetical protein